VFVWPTFVADEGGVSGNNAMFVCGSHDEQGSYVAELPHTYMKAHRRQQHVRYNVLAGFDL